MAKRAGDGAWELCGHAEVVDAANNAARFSSQVSSHLQLPNGLDGEPHRAYRELVDRYMTADRVAALEPMLREVANALTGDLPVAFDAVTGLGEPFAVRAQTRWLGWPEALEAELIGWIAANRSASRSGSRDERAAVARRFDDLIRSVLLPRRQAEPGDAPDDVTAELIADESLGRPLSDEELVSILRNWTGGDLGSLALCVGVVMHFLATHPAVAARIRAGVPTGKLGAIIDEILRIDDPFVASRRIAACPIETGGSRIETGEPIRLDWASANRDPDRFTDPLAFDPALNAAGNLVYGTGPHVCPGRALATLELCVLTEALVAATESIELDPGNEPVRSQPPAGGWERVPLLVRFS